MPSVVIEVEVTTVTKIYFLKRRLPAILHCLEIKHY